MRKIARREPINKARCREPSSCPARPSRTRPSTAPQPSHPPPNMPHRPPPKHRAPRRRPPSPPALRNARTRLMPNFPHGPTASRSMVQRHLPRMPRRTSAPPARARNARLLPRLRPYCSSRPAAPACRTAEGLPRHVLRGLALAPSGSLNKLHVHMCKMYDSAVCSYLTVR